MSDVLNEIVQKQQRYSANDKRHDERNGEQRATLTDPAAVIGTIDLIIEETIRDAELEAAGYGLAAANERARLHREITHHDNRLTEELYVERQNAQAERQQNLANLDGEFGDNAASTIRLQDRARDAEALLTNVRARVTPRRRPLRTHWRSAFLPIMALIALIEMPLNQLSFEFVLREAPAFAWLLALACGIILVSFAHLAGLWTRQLNPFQIKRVIVAFKALAILGVSVVAVLLIYIVAGLRQRYIDHQNLPQANLETGILADQSVLDRISDAVAAAAIDTTLSYFGWLIFGVNLVFFAFGALLSFYRHDPDPDYEKVQRAFDAAQQALTAQRTRYQQQKNRLDATFSEEQRQLEIEISKAETEVTKARESLDALDRRREPDLRVVATCALARASHRLSGFYRRSGERGMAPPQRPLPSVVELVSRFEETVTSTSSHTPGGRTAYSRSSAFHGGAADEREPMQ